MGKLLSKSFFSKPEESKPKLLLIGLDSAGKTTIIEKIKTTEVEERRPQIGVYIELFETTDFSFACFDLSIQRLKILFKPYYENIKGIIFVVDSQDIDRIELVKDEINYFLSVDQLKDVPLLILANKQDIPAALTVENLTEVLDLNKIQNRNWHIQSSCAVSNKGINEGFDWISDIITSKSFSS